MSGRAEASLGLRRSAHMADRRVGVVVHGACLNLIGARHHDLP